MILRVPHSPTQSIRLRSFCFSRQEVNLVVTQQIDRGRGGLLDFGGVSTDVFVELTLITSLSEFISVFKQLASSVVFDPTTTPVTSSRLYLSYDHLQSFRMGCAIVIHTTS